ncbi:MAG: hypothetical protein PHC85_03180 [Candidatus Pacebacteria bacterium]|nr:hypothetical protein [Candidatus Paceibacterota bacterium]
MAEIKKEKIEKIKNLIEELLLKMNVLGQVEVIENIDGFQFIIRTHEGGLLIGENGKTLVSFNHIIKKIIGKEVDKDETAFAFSLDVNDYQTKRIEDLKNIARVNAQRVRFFKKEVALRAMSSFERRVIHAILSDYPDITTESKGSEPRRQVVIKPYP